MDMPFTNHIRPFESITVMIFSWVTNMMKQNLFLEYTHCSVLASKGYTHTLFQCSWMFSVAGCQLLGQVCYRLLLCPKDLVFGLNGLFCHLDGFTLKIYISNSSRSAHLVTWQVKHCQSFLFDGEFDKFIFLLTHQVVLQLCFIWSTNKL